MAGATSASGAWEDKELADLMNELGIIEEDIDDLVYEDIKLEQAMEARWLEIDKVHTNREYGDFWFYKNLRNHMGSFTSCQFLIIG